MQDFIDWLKQKQDNIENLIDPGDEIEPAEKVLGEMSQHLKELYTVLATFRDELEMEVEHLQEQYPSPDDLPKEKKESIELRSERLELLHDYFWHEVRNEFGRYDCLGVREDFTVVTWKQEHSGVSAPPEAHIGAVAALRAFHEEMGRDL